MTGELTLRGTVLPIGGLKEKLLAAQRGGIKTVVIPHENVKDLADIPDNIKGQLSIEPVRWIEEVLRHALERDFTVVKTDTANGWSLQLTPTKKAPSDAMPIARIDIAGVTGASAVGVVVVSR